MLNMSLGYIKAPRGASAAPAPSGAARRPAARRGLPGLVVFFARHARTVNKIAKGVFLQYSGITPKMSDYSTILALMSELVTNLYLQWVSHVFGSGGRLLATKIMINA